MWAICLIALLGVQWVFSLSMGICGLSTLVIYCTLVMVDFLSLEFPLLFLLVIEEFMDRAGKFSPENSLV